MFSNCTYQWSNNVSTNKIGTNLWAGWQYVTITHTDGCVVVDSSLIPDAAPVISASNIQHIKCQDYTQGGGKIDLLLNDPANTSLLWSTGQTTSSITALQAGTYIVSVNTTAGCVSNDTFTVTIPDTLVSNVSGLDLLCYNDSSGILSVVPTGGTAPYSYFWSTSDTTDMVMGQSTGTYSVFILDSLGCFILDSVSISQPNPFTATATTQDILCNGQNDGMITINLLGGQGSVNFSWSNNTSDSLLASVAAGMYSVLLTDSAGCAFGIDSMIINEPPAIQMTIQSSPVIGNCDGEINSAISGGTSPYQFAWSNGDTTTDLTGLCTGQYTLTVTDANGCILIDSVNVGIVSTVFDHESDEIVLSPNPVKNMLYIQTKKSQIYRVFVVDIIGQVIFEKEQIPSMVSQISVGDIPAGIYHIQVFNSAGLITTRPFVVID